MHFHEMTANRIRSGKVQETSWNSRKDGRDFALYRKSGGKLWLRKIELASTVARYPLQ
jgi:hypothetical protein